MACSNVGGYANGVLAVRIIYGEQAHFFEDEIRPHLRHEKRGMVAMAGEEITPLTIISSLLWFLRFLSSQLLRK